MQHLTLASQPILPWHATLWQRFTARIQCQQLPHAVLLMGLPGCGKRYFAERLAEFILCQEPREQGSCGDCKSCQLLAGGHHPDLLRVVPENKSHSICVDDIRHLNEWVTQSAYGQGYKVVIIDPAEVMNLAASNSLLKTLEEPVSQTIFLLVSSSPIELLPTIRSRCQFLKFNHLDSAASQAWLKSQIDPSLDLALLLHLAHGAPFKALALADAAILKSRRDFLEDMIQLLLRKLDPVDAAVRWYQADLPWLLQNAYALLIDMIKINLNPVCSDLYHDDFADRLQGMVGSLSLSQLLSIQDKIQEVIRASQERFNLNAQLLLEDLFIEMYQRHLFF